MTKNMIADSIWQKTKVKNVKDAPVFAMSSGSVRVAATHRSIRCSQ